MTTLLRIAVLATALGFVGAAHAQDVTLRAALSGGNVVSVTESLATGEVSAVLGDDDTLQLDLVFAGLALEATGAALHTGMYNENGPAVAELDIGTGATEGRIVGAQLSLTPTIAAHVRGGESYVVITTIEHPDGAIRGQLMPQPASLSDVPGGAADVPAAVMPTPVTPAPATPAPATPAPATPPTGTTPVDSSEQDQDLPPPASDDDD